MSFDYAVEVYDIGTPLKNGITVLDVLSFWNLYQKKQSKFYLWYNTNINKINDANNNKNAKQILNKYIN